MESNQSSLPPFSLLLAPLAVTPELRLSRWRGGGGEGGGGGGTELSPLSLLQYLKNVFKNSSSKK